MKTFILLLSVITLTFFSCRKKEKIKDLFLSGQIVDSSQAPIATRSMVLYTLDYGGSFNNKYKFYPFSFATDESGKFRVMFNLENDVDAIQIFYAGESVDGNRPLYYVNVKDDKAEIDAGVIIVPRK